MRIALVFPESTFLSSSNVWPPLGLFYLAAQLEAQGYQTEFFDMGLGDKLPNDGEYDQMWISGTSPQMHSIRKIGEHTKNFKHTKTVFGGAAAWANPQSALELPFDLIVSGEADHPETVAQILHRVNEPYKLYSPPMHKDLDWVLPPIRRWNLRYHSYMTDSTGKSYRMASIFTARGCPMSCAFCESGRHGVIWGSMTRYEPVDKVEAQIKDIVDMGFTGLAYYDDIFILNKQRTEKLLDLHVKYNLTFRCFLRSDILQKHGGKEYLRKMKDAGLIEIFVGVESASNQIKNNIHKGTTIEQDTNVVNWCHELGVLPKCSLILGLPGETRETMETTRQWILQQDPSRIRIQVDRLIPFKGTPLTDHPEEYDLKYQEQPDEEWFFKGRMDLDTHSFVSTSSLSVQEIDEFWRSLENEMREKGYRS